MPTENETEISEENSSSSQESDDTQSVEETHSDLMDVPIESADLVSTTEFSAPEVDETSKDDKTESDDKKDEKSADSKEKDENKDEKKLSEEETAKIDVTFQDSPRFKELLDQKNESRNEVKVLNKQVETLTDLVKSFGGKKNEKGTDPGFKDVLQMTDEDIIENFESDPKGFLANFAKQVSHDIQSNIVSKGKENQKLSEKQAQEKAVDELYSDYENKNPDFITLWEDGTIRKYMDENPGNTPISAHKILKAADLEKDLTSTRDQEIEKAVKKAVDKATQNFKAKQSSRTLSAGPGGGSQANKGKTPIDLADTKNHGGLMQVLTQRSLAREKSA